MTFGFTAAGSEELRAVRVATGRITRRVRLTERLDAEVSGKRVRVLQRTRSGLELDEFGADGKRRRRHRFGLAAGVTPSFMGGSLRDGMVLLSTTTGAVAPYRHELVPFGGTAHPIGLTGAVYRFVTPSIVADAEGKLARLDRRTLTVRREVNDAPGGWLTPFAGGVAVGLGNRLYDSRLALVAAHPSVPAAASAPVASGTRLYALTLRCTVSGPRGWRDRCRCADRVCRRAPQRSVRHRAARRPGRQARQGRLRLTALRPLVDTVAHGLSLAGDRRRRCIPHGQCSRASMGEDGTI